MNSGAEVVGKNFAQTFESGVNEKSNVAGGKAGDLMDFLVTESLLEFEGDDFPLVVG